MKIRLYDTGHTLSCTYRYKVQKSFYGLFWKTIYSSDNFQYALNVYNECTIAKTLYEKSV